MKTDSQDKIHWISTKMFSYYQPGTPINISITFDTSISQSEKWGSTHNACKTVVMIKDNRIEGNSRISIDLHYPELFLYTKSIASLMSAGINEAYQKGYTNRVDKNYGKFYKNLLFKFTVSTDGSRWVEVSIIDKSSSRNTATINMKLNDWLGFHSILCDLKANFISNSLSILNVCESKRDYELNEAKLEEINSSVKTLEDSLRSGLNSIRGTMESAPRVSNVSDNISIEPEDIKEPETFTNVDSEFTLPHDLMESEENESIKEPVTDVPIDIIEEEDTTDGGEYLQDIFDEEVDLGEGTASADSLEALVSSVPPWEDLPEDTSSKKPVAKEKDSHPFLSSLLNYDLGYFRELKTAINLVGLKSDPNMFAPHSYIMDSCAVSKDEMDTIQGCVGYYNSQAYMILCLKESIVNDLKGKGLGNCDIVKFKDFTITKDNSVGLWNISKYSIVSFLVYTHLKSMINKLENKDDEVNCEYLRTWYMIKTIFLPFFVSSDLMTKDLEELKTELWDVYTNIQQSGALQKIETDYANVTLNGRITFDHNTFEVCLKAMLNAIKSNKLATILSDDVPLQGLNNNEDVRAHMIKTLKWDISAPTKANQKDKKLNLFVKCVKSEISAEEMEALTNSCSSYENLTNFLEDNKLSSKGNVLKIKRILDLFPELTRKTEVQRKLETFEEEPEVTESRVLDHQDEMIEEDDDLTATLFGDTET